MPTDIAAGVSDQSKLYTDGTNFLGHIRFEPRNLMPNCLPGLLSAMDLVEVNPELGTPYQRAKTMEAACAIIMGALGKPRQGVPYHPGFEIPLP